MSQLIQQSQHTQVLHQLVTVNAQSILRMAPKSAGDPARLLRIAFNAVVYDDKLSMCLTTQDGKASIVGGIMEAIKLGITIGGPMQEGWLIPFNIHGTMKAQLLVGYQGYRNIIDRARSVIDFVPRAVHVKDAENFDYELGSRPVIRYKPRFPQPTTKADLLCCFGVANLRGGGQQIDVLLVDEVEAHRLRSRAKDSGPWQTDYPAMGMKTVVRKMAKYLPKSNELLSRAIDLDNKLDSGAEQDFDLEDIVIPKDDAPAATRPKALEALKDNLGIVPTAKKPAAVKVSAEFAVGEERPPEEMTAEDFGAFGGGE